MLKRFNFVSLGKFASVGLIAVFTYNQYTWESRLQRDFDLFKSRVVEILPEWKISAKLVDFPLIAATTDAVFIPSPGRRAETPQEFVERFIAHSGSQGLSGKTVVFPGSSAASADYYEYSFGACEPGCAYDLFNLSGSTRNEFDLYYLSPKGEKRFHKQLALEHINGRAFSSHLTIEKNSLGEVRSYTVSFRIMERGSWDSLRFMIRNRSLKGYLSGQFERRNVFLEGFD